MTDDDTITTEQFETAMYVLETLRDETLPEEAVGERRTLNDAHAVVDEQRDQLDDGWDVADTESLTTPLTLRQMVRCTPATVPYGKGYDLVGSEWQGGGLELTWEQADEVATDGRGDDQVRGVEPATPDEVPDACEFPECEAPIENFDEAFPVSPRWVDDEHLDSEGRMVLCDPHHVAARILAYTKMEPPYVDVGIYQEVAFYARSLAGVTMGVGADEVVTAPSEVDDGN